MYNVIIENENGDQLDLMNTEDMICVSIDGCAGASATINETENATLDGSVINSERLNSRTITLSIRIFNNCGTCRELIYQHTVIKKYIKLTLINDIRSVYIEGQVKSVEADPFTQKESMTIEIVCPEPFFNEVVAVMEEFSYIIKMLHFELAIEKDGIPFGCITDTIQAEVVNTGECDTGIIFTLTASKAVKNPKISNMETGEYFGLNYEMREGEEITINTIDKNKSIISKYNNVTTNILNSRDKTSTWLVAKVGSTKFTYTADSGFNDLEVTFNYQNKYLGV